MSCIKVVRVHFIGYVMTFKWYFNHDDERFVLRFVKFLKFLSYILSFLLLLNYIQKVGIFKANELERKKHVKQLIKAT